MTQWCCAFIKWYLRNTEFFGSGSVALCYILKASQKHVITTTAKPSLLCFLIDVVLTEKTKALILEFYLKLRLLTLFIQWFLFVKSLFLLELRLKIKYIWCPFLCIIKFFLQRKSYQLKWSQNCPVANLSISGALCIHSFIYHKAIWPRQTNK